MTGFDQCPLCSYTNIQVSSRPEDIYLIECGRCKEFLITEECMQQTPKQVFDDIGYVLSALSRELHENDMARPELTSTNLIDLTKHYLVPDLNSVEAKAEKFLFSLKRKTTYFGETVYANYSIDYPLAYARNLTEYKALIKLLEQKELIKNQPVPTLGGPAEEANLQITAQGWEISNKFTQKNTEFTQGFIASWFNESTDESIAAISQGIEDAGYTPLCIKDEHFSERIMDKALGEIRKSRFVVIDLTGSRNSVFFEAGFSFGLGIECIYVYKKPDVEKSTLSLEFYVKHYQCYEYTTAEELREKVKNAINARIKK